MTYIVFADGGVALLCQSAAEAHAEVKALKKLGCEAAVSRRFATRSEAEAFADTWADKRSAIMAKSVTNNGARKRQTKFRERMQAEGMIQVSAWVHDHQRPAATQLLRRLNANPELTPGPLRNTDTNRFESLEADDED